MHLRYLNYIRMLGKKTTFGGISDYLVREESMAGIVAADGQAVLIGQEVWVVEARDWYWRIFRGKLDANFTSRGANVILDDNPDAGLVGANYMARHLDIFSTAVDARIELGRRIDANRNYLTNKLNEMRVVQNGLDNWDGSGAGFNLLPTPAARMAWSGGQDDEQQSRNA